MNRYVNTALGLTLAYIAASSPAFAAAAGAGAAGLTQAIGTEFGAFMRLTIQLLAAAAFLVVGYGVIMKFMSAISGRAEWGEVILPVVFGAVVLIISAYMFTEAETLATAIGT